MRLYPRDSSNPSLAACEPVTYDNAPFTVSRTGRACSTAHWAHPNPLCRHRMRGADVELRYRVAGTGVEASLEVRLKFAGRIGLVVDAEARIENQVGGDICSSTSTRSCSN